MTREERLKLIKHLKYACSIGADYTITDNDVDEIIRALQQDPCEDAVSREDALMALTGEWTELTDELIHQFIRRIKNLPPVNLQLEPTACEDAVSRQTMLDKIKSDIFNACSDNYHMPVYKLDCDTIFEIIDKYKAKSEVKE